MKSSSSNGRSCLTLALWLVVLSACVGLVATITLVASPASAAFFEAPTPTQANLWGYMALPKPTYAPTVLAPTALPPTEAPALAPVPAPVSTETPGQMTMQIVDSSSAPDSSSQPPAPAPAYGGSKLILVDISEQHMYVYDGDTLVYSFVVSTGRNNYTKVGTFAVQDKIPNAYGSTWDIWMPNWLGIYYAGGSENGIHALPILPNGATLWSGYLGTPISYGCVVLDTYDAEVLYNWADIGTPVEIQW
jgi:lipoprotein-anchoring transpeptidase ErfK/SrfK